MLKRPIHTSSHASNYQQCTTPPPQPLMNSKCVYDRSSYLPPRYGSPNSLTSFASRQCYECHRFDGDTSWNKKKPSSLHSSSIKVPVNNLITKVLVDTGATLSLIQEQTLQ
ncbi:unnamed protein product, partial [Rotaria magnacalcarata]